ncbi:MAG: helix-turn-helix domain-containing protein [Deltaproteobacteria bacterium]|nr:helix-turn-helix domain-containing protein [Deltaproteobacteria bacterium]
MPDILTEHEAAAYLRVTIEEVVALLEAGEIRARGIGAGRRIHRDALDALAEGR